MNNTSKILLGSLLLGSLGFASCSDDFLDINRNPNLPESAAPHLVLASGTLNMAYVLGGQFQIAGNFLAQHWTQNLGSNQYKELDKYNILQTTYDAPFVTLFAGAQQDFQVVINQAKGDSSNYAAIAGIEQAFTYQLLSDAYDRVPFTEALRGIQNTQPRYDEGPDIYDGAINLINQSVGKINPNGISPAGQDVVFNGDMNKWRRFANTLKLRIFLRQVYVRPSLAADSIRAMFNRGAQFLGDTENAQIAIFTSNNKNGNPVYLSELGSGSGISNNIVASATSINYLTNTIDPRIDDLFDRPNNSTGAFVGTLQGLAGTPNPPAPPISQLSRPDVVKIIGPTAPVILISGAESMFLQAEAAVRGFSNGNAKALYERGITSSWNRLGTPITRTEITGTPPNTVTTVIPVLANFLSSDTINLDRAPLGEGPNSKLDRIITQKWVSMSGSQGFEAWSELRRTNFPSFISPSLSSTLLPGVVANRFLYPATESARNPNTPAVEFTQVPVWWDRKPL